MAREVVEVVARFGSTILDVAHLEPSDTYRIGSAPGTRLAVPGVTSFPLVTGGSVRCPVGMRASDEDGITVLSIGALAIHVTRTKLPHAPLARPRFDWRPPAFVLASLVAHLAIWFAALAYAPLERVAAPRAPRPRLVHVAAVPPPADEPRPTPRRPVSAQAPPPRPVRVARAETTGIAAARSKTVTGAVASVLESFDRIDVAGKLGALDPKDAYNPELDASPSFGSGRSFDPSQREGFGTIESGPYEMIPPDVRLCPDKSCTVNGPIPALYVRTHLHSVMDGIYACYVRYADGPGTIVLEFTITADGAVRDARGSGLGETGACAARVTNEIFFKALGSETRVRYPVRFLPPPF
jgi:hypothetical protein